MEVNHNTINRYYGAFRRKTFATGLMLNRSGSFVPGGRLRSPYFADIFVRRESLQDFEPFGKIVGHHEVVYYEFSVVHVSHNDSA